MTIKGAFDPKISVTLLDSMPFVAWLKDPDGRYLDVNQFFADYTGLPKEAIIGKTDYDIYSKEEADIYVSSDKAVLAGENHEFYESHINGIWKEEYKKKLYDEQGRLIGIGGYAKDITLRKRVEEAYRQSERSKATLISNLPGVAFRCHNDPQWTMVFLSEGCYELTGYRPEELLNNNKISYNELITPDFREPLFKRWTEDIEQLRKSSDEYTITKKSGEIRWVWEQSIPVLGDDGTYSETEGFILDITQIKSAQSALNASEERFRTIFNEAPLGIGIFNTRTQQALQVNRKFTEILGRSAEELSTLDWKVYSYPDDIEENMNWLRQLEAGTISGFSMDKRFIHLNGTIIWVKMTIVPFKENSIHNHHLCMLEDITESKKRQEDILYLSYHDALTGLYNRAFFEEEQKRFNAKRNSPYSLIMGDINGLKLINDSLGHTIGDELLREAAKLLLDACRKEDLIARIGGDEFVILLDQTDGKEAGFICRRIYRAFREYNLKAERSSFYLSISLGHATKFRDGQTFNELLARAEKMLYKRKNADRAKTRGEILKAAKLELGLKLYSGENSYNEKLDQVKTLTEQLSVSPEHLKEMQQMVEAHDINALRQSGEELT